MITGTQNTRNQRRRFRTGRQRFAIWQAETASRATQRFEDPLVNAVLPVVATQARKGWLSRLKDKVVGYFQRKAV